MTDEHPVPLDKSEFLARVESSWLRLMGFVEALTPARLSEPRDAAGWTVKDHLAHLAAWERGIISLLHDRPRHEGMGVDASLYFDDDLDALNEGIRQSTEDIPLGTVLDDLQLTHANLVAQIESIPNEDLQRTYSWFLPEETGADDGRSILFRVAGNTFEHYDEHLPWMTAILER